MVKVSGHQAAQNRSALVDAARRLLQERGFDRAGVAEIGREAGLTQGALYGQFASKDALAAEAVRQAFADGACVWHSLADGGGDALRAYLKRYLSDDHLAEVGTGCILAACLSDVRRQTPAVGSAFTEGIVALADTLQRALPPGLDPAEARRRTLAVMAGLVGGVALARSVALTDAGLAAEILAATRAELERLAVSPPPAGTATGR